VFHWLVGTGQSLMPPFGSLRLHAYPWSGNRPGGVFVGPQQVWRHSEPEGPLPTVDGAVTQHLGPTLLPAQSLCRVQDTHTGAAQIEGSGWMHRLTDGQQTNG
jgi:hypothetical protein